jgi:hypothetical protein
MGCGSKLLILAWCLLPLSAGTMAAADEVPSEASEVLACRFVSQEEVFERISADASVVSIVGSSLVFEDGLRIGIDPTMTCEMVAPSVTPLVFDLRFEADGLPGPDLQLFKWAFPDRHGADRMIRDFASNRRCSGQPSPCHWYRRDDGHTLYLALLPPSATK